MQISWVTSCLHRLCQQQAGADPVIGRMLTRSGRPLRSNAEQLTDADLLDKLRSFGIDLDREGLSKLCEGALSADNRPGPGQHRECVSINLGIDRRGQRRAVPKDLPDLGERDARPQRRGRGGVAQPVGVHLAQAGALRGIEHDHRHSAGGQRPMRGVHADEHAAPLRGPGPAAAQIPRDRRAHFGGHR